MKNEQYNGFEVGPIRPPSEATSLMLRVSRNCPWNRCKFCGLYKGKPFSMRSVEHIINDIDTIKEYVDRLTGKAGKPGFTQGDDLNAIQSAAQWIRNGMESVFLQDGNSMILKPADLEAILLHLRKQFPTVQRITTYARSQNLHRMKDEDLDKLAKAGLNRIHIGMESGSDSVLSLINKGVTKQEQIIAGQKVKNAGIELSVYFMPGLGGKAFTQANALETADAFNQINPDFIRMRTLGIPQSVELYDEVKCGNFTRLNDVEVIQELKLFFSHLKGIDSVIISDHILNLLQELEGQLPNEKEQILQIIDRFLALSEQEQLIFRVGRRVGIYSKLSDINDRNLMQNVEDQIRANGINQHNLDMFTSAMMERFI